MIKTIQKLVRKVYLAKMKAVFYIITKSTKMWNDNKELDTKFIAQLITSLYSYISSQLVMGSVNQSYMNTGIDQYPRYLEDNNKFKYGNVTK